jgi:hypothetical protein
MEFLEEYKCLINYHPGKANVVADALSRKVRMARLGVQEVKLVEEVLSMEADVDEGKISLRNLSIVTNLRKEIVDLQLSSKEFKEMKRRNHEFRVDNFGVMYFKDQLYVPNDEELKKKILDETHKSRYTIHPGETKMYQDLKKVLLWPGMNKYVRRCVLACLTCQKVKAKHNWALI